MIVTRSVNSALVADADPIRSENLLNHLLICGVENPVLERREHRLLHVLDRRYFDLLIIDFELYNRPAVRKVVNRRCRSQPFGVVVLMNDDSVPRFEALRDSEYHMCVQASSAAAFLTRLITGRSR